MEDATNEFPPPEALGGWRWIAGPDEARERTGVDTQRLDLEVRRQLLLYGGESWSLAVIRHGWLAAEYATFNVASTTAFDIWSCTKSITALAWGILLHDPAAQAEPVSLDTPVYRLIPARQPLSDARKAHITIGQVLSMTSGIPGESQGLYGMPLAASGGAFEFALGHGANRYGARIERLQADPGTMWDYSDPAYCHLGLAFAQAAGMHMAAFMRSRVFEPAGLGPVLWEDQGGRGFLGPFTNAHTGFHISARDLARLGYLVLRGGRWGDRQLVPAAWLAQMTVPSQPFNRAYGYGWWTNRDGAYLPGLPTDLVAMSGYRANRCYVIPSLDLVVARTGGGPVGWDEPQLLKAIIAALV
jgi:CubicO group peptidase (beta-lactamase class C family)